LFQLILLLSLKSRSLYDGPFIAERLSTLYDFYHSRKDDIHPVTQGILKRGHDFNAVQTFQAFRRLEALRREAHEVWDNNELDALILPTVSVTPTISEILEVPVGLNTVLGLYTNFVNLLDLCGLAVPNTFLPGSGMPFGITILGRAMDDHFVYQVGRVFQAARDLPLGALEFKLPAKSSGNQTLQLHNDFIDIAVCGAHLKGLPLNRQLTDLNGKLVKACKTSPNYALYDISKPGDKIKRPGMVRSSSGTGIEVEVWRIPRTLAGEFLENIKPPLALGNVQLDDGSVVKGFVCEGHAIEGANDISNYGGWRGYIKK